ncbi:hypothetical protein ACIP2X_24810 [Streptomyces sp. NPDC089424]|uniref:hypothetical protein n=1 Tax=Streptomyces sp. NPDC089424 TaxID=3365917 RepID=UPI003803BD2A
MNAPRARRLFAMSAIGVLMAGGAAIGAAGTASAATPTTHVPSNWGGDDWRDRGGWGYNNFGYFNNFGGFGGYGGYGYGGYGGYGGSPVVIVVR